MESDVIMKQILLQIYFSIQKKFFSKISKKDYDALICNGKILEQDRKGIKVVEIDNGDIVKMFRLKRLFSSAFFFPYAWRFKKNAMQLKEKGINTVDVKKIAYCLEIQRHVLVYKKIAGQTIRDLLVKNKDNKKLLADFIVFIARLHKEGVYFRSLHFGNVIVDDEGNMALIDIADMKIYVKELSVKQRVRNWKHMVKYDHERAVINDYGWEGFFLEYSSYSQLSESENKHLLAAI